jgi:hypothetical protein
LAVAAPATAQEPPAIDSQAYQEQDAATKRDRLWAEIEADPYQSLPSGGTIDAAAKLVFRHKITPSFDRNTDVRPKRRKIFHSYGATAKVRYVPVRRGIVGALAQGQPAPGDYTGVFETGAVGVARLSLGLGEHPLAPWIPGIAVKLFVDGEPSVNIHALPRDGAQTNKDFMAATHSTKLDPTPLDGLLRFASRGADPSHRKTDHVAAVEADGTLVSQPKSPFKLELRPAPQTYVSPPAWGDEDFRISLARIPEGGALYEVYAYPAEGTDDDDAQHIGDLILESPFVATAFQDERLHFRHVR